MLLDEDYIMVKRSTYLYISLFHDVTFIVIICSAVAAVAAGGCSLMGFISILEFFMLLYAALLTYVPWAWWVREGGAWAPCGAFIGVRCPELPSHSTHSSTHVKTLWGLVLWSYDDDIS